MTDAFSIIIAANNEEAYIGPCLDAILAQRNAGHLRIIVAANACTDRTVQIVRDRQASFAAAGHQLDVLEIAEPGKLNALNRADEILQGSTSARMWLDADVICGPDLCAQLRKALATETPRYATGRLVVAPARSWTTRRYAALWQRLPFVKGGAVGAGLFALNAAGRARFDRFPSIISDDTFVRLHFTPEERVEVPAGYHWPMVEGFERLVRVRRRQDAGVIELARLYPHLMGNERKAPLTRPDLLKLAMRHPVDFSVYLAVHLAVRLRASTGEWTRGR
ncbi:glycosyltransferase [Falsirhodobacter deserti]|uniref:glycosyltransferase n=1 Tax=Falsirhodobacter deserti TaxID=1365611 RepID=UPI001F4D5B1B|nr:glycosyltransferase [Falsirhodobacter deserti]